MCRVNADVIRFIPQNIKIVFFHFYFLNQDFFLTIISITLLFDDLVDPMCCILLFYNSQPYIADPYIAAYFGYLMIHNHYLNISREVKTVYFTMVPQNYP